MRTLFITILSIIFIQPVFANGTVDKDTVVINFGNSSKMIILVKSQEDLDLIKQYDINGILKDLSLAIDTASDANYLKIKDETGERYLKDTTIVITDPKSNLDEDSWRYTDKHDEWRYDDDYSERDYKSGDDRESVKANVRIGNVEVSIDNLDDPDKIEQDFEDFKFEKREYKMDRSLGTKHSLNMDLGINNWLSNGEFPESNELYAVRPLWSFYVAFNSTFKTSISGPLFLEWGGGIDWYNFKLENDNVQIFQGDDNVEFIEISDVNAIKSKLTVNYINVKLVPMLDFSYGRRLAKEMGNRSVKITRYKKQGFRIGAGIYGGYRLSSYSKFVYKESGDREKEHIRKSFYLNNWRYGVRVQMGYKGVDVFMTYDLNELFREGRGPELNPITFGITI